jgi:F-type H+-transporting ATPase subunit a
LHEQGTWLHFFYTYHIIPHWLPEATLVSWFIIAGLSLLAIASTRNLKSIPNGLQNLMEMVVSTLDGFVKGLVGPQHDSRFTPLIGTFFVYILVMNLFGLIPGFISPTANINTTVSLALTAFVLVQYYGIKHVGLKNYLRHFAGDPIWLAPLMIPIHIIGELARPLSLSIRLFGNMFGEDMVIGILILVVIQVLGKIPLPAQFPMLLLGVFTSFVQALVFSTLVAIYISLAISQEHEGAHD